MHLHILRYLPLLGFAAIMLYLIIKRWDFIREILSDGKAGSATRTGGMIFILTVAFCEVYTTVKTQAFDYKHLVAILTAIGVLFGFIKVVDLISIWRNGKIVPESETVKKEENTTTNTNLKTETTTTLKQD